MICKKTALLNGAVFFAWIISKGIFYQRVSEKENCPVFDTLTPLS